MNTEWDSQNREYIESQKLLIKIKGTIREKEKNQSWFSKLSLILLNSKKEKLESKIHFLKQKLS